jgi:tellurite resistance protein TehA-like permease
LSKLAKDLDPACFSIVMATGIVSLACWQYQASSEMARLLAIALLWSGGLAYLILIALTLIRMFCHLPDLAFDIADHRRTFGFFSIVAASCVLGRQVVLIAASPALAISLWCFGIATWFLLTYGIFTVLTVKQNKPPLRDGLHGGWLLAVVATQSVSLLGGSLSAEFHAGSEPVLFFSLGLWLGGGMLYAWIISLIFYRYCFEPVDRDSMSPPYWINMGAMAISALAGATLLNAAQESSLLYQFLGFIRGTTLLCWATATWWIPLLVALGVWRHAYQRAALNYDLRYWSMVFPLGMYSVCTHAIVQSFDLQFLNPIAIAFAVIAIFTWTATTLGMLRRMVGLTQATEIVATKMQQSFGE